MSLIDEALKRARQEAAKQDEAARELRYRQVPVIPGLRPRARRPWLLPVLLAIITACLLVGVGIGLALSGRDGEDQRAAVPPQAAAPRQAASQAAPEPLPPSPSIPAVVEDKPAPPVVVEKTPEPRSAPEPVAPPARPVQSEEPAIADMRQREIVLKPTRESAPPAPAPAAPLPVATAPSAPEPAAPAPTEEAGQVRTYQQELPLAGGGTLRLNGIAFSEQPVALFGDKVVAPGESVAGYKVVAIEARRVRLEGQGGVVVVEMP
ncbi:MAG TPA: hypothetical protein VKM72_16190 [Thermoanaerobaculia bacterium]|nr:hypothetical protein [Thermoanaerobaculia bacterium]